MAQQFEVDGRYVLSFIHYYMSVAAMDGVIKQVVQVGQGAQVGVVEPIPTGVLARPGEGICIVGCEYAI